MATGNKNLAGNGWSRAAIDGIAAWKARWANALAYEDVCDAARAGLDLLYPPVCLLCGQELFHLAGQGQVLLCQVCREQVIEQRASCPRCGAGLAQATADLESCPHCRTTRFRFRRVVSLGSYQGPLHAAIVRAKNRQHGAVAMQLAELFWLQRAEALLACQCDGVLAIPSHWKRRLQHGHNSAEVVAATLARRAKLPLAAGLLTRIRETRPQRELSPTQRWQNVRDAFAVKPHPDLVDARLLLVDDVLTTGATANEAAKALLAAGAAEVYVAVLARAVGDH